MRKPMQGERLMAYGSFPGLADMADDLNAKPWTPEQVEKKRAQSCGSSRSKTWRSFNCGTRRR